MIWLMVCNEVGWGLLRVDFDKRYAKYHASKKHKNNFLKGIL
ncbi:hypothetical protein [Helicobacter sp. T3_23-1056]